MRIYNLYLNSFHEIFLAHEPLAFELSTLDRACNYMRACGYLRIRAATVRGQREA